MCIIVMIEWKLIILNAVLFCSIIKLIYTSPAFILNSIEVKYIPNIQLFVYKT